MKQKYFSYRLISDIGRPMAGHRSKIGKTRNFGKLNVNRKKPPPSPHASPLIALKVTASLPSNTALPLPPQATIHVPTQRHTQEASFACTPARFASNR